MIAGTVTDKRGALLAGVAVELVDETTSARSLTVTDGYGKFLFTNLKPGRYSLHIENPYFKELVITEIMLESDRTIRLTPALEVKSEIVGMMEFTAEPISTDANQLSDHLILKKPQ